MKTFLKSIFKFIQSIFLQVLLGFVAFTSFEECRITGNMFEVGTYEKEIDYKTTETVGTAIVSGFNGGTIAMGIICSVCLIMIVWLEINKKSKSQLFTNIEILLVIDITNKMEKVKNILINVTFWVVTIVIIGGCIYLMLPGFNRTTNTNSNVLLDNMSSNNKLYGGFVVLIVFVCVFVTVVSVYAYRNYSRIKKYVVRSVSEKV